MAGTDRDGFGGRLCFRKTGGLLYSFRGGVTGPLLIGPEVLPNGMVGAKRTKFFLGPLDKSENFPLSMFKEGVKKPTPLRDITNVLMAGATVTRCYVFKFLISFFLSLSRVIQKLTLNNDNF